MLHYALAPAVTGTAAPPIPKAKAWGRTYAASPLATTNPLLDLSQGVPGTAPSASILSALSRTAGTPEAAQYGPILGEPALRTALARELRELYSTANITDEDVGITTGCNMAFLILLMALCPPGESKVLLPLPAYFNHAMSLSLQGVTPAYIPAPPGDGFQPSLDAARAILQAKPEVNGVGKEVKARAIVLTTPNNPTGAVYRPEELKEWLALAREHSVPLVLDETYREFTPKEERHKLFDDAKWRESLVSLGSFSKGYRIPGHRLGSITAPPDLLTHIATIADCMQICPPRAPQLALAPLLSSQREDLVESATALAHRLELFAATLKGVAGWKVLSSGGFYAYVEYPEQYLSPSPAARKVLGLEAGEQVGSEQVGRALALQAGVLTLPGCFFMPPLDDAKAWAGIGSAGEAMRADRWVRFAVANVSDETVRELGKRLSGLNETFGM